MYFKNIENGYIVSLTTNYGQVEVAVEEYNVILDIIHAKPTDPDGYAYMLRADTLEWELVELPPEPEPGDEEVGEEDYIQVLDDLGVRLS